MPGLKKDYHLGDFKCCGHPSEKWESCYAYRPISNFDIYLKIRYFKAVVILGEISHFVYFWTLSSWIGVIIGQCKQWVFILDT